MASQSQKTVYVALLRGINVGGNNKIDMKALACCFENLGFEQVRTYINSGNVIFASDQSAETANAQIETAIQNHFGLSIKVQLRNLAQMRVVCETLPDFWVKNETMRADVMFVEKEADSPNILEQLALKPTDEAMYVPGAVLWKIGAKDYHTSGMAKLASNSIYKKMTVRNVNTVRKIFELMGAVTA